MLSGFEIYPCWVPQSLEVYRQQLTSPTNASQANSSREAMETLPKSGYKNDDVSWLLNTAFNATSSWEMTYAQLVSPIRLYLRTLLVSFLPRGIVSEDLSIEQWPIFDQSSRFVKLFRIFGWDPWKTGNQRNCSTVYIDLLNKSTKNSLILHCIRLYSLYKARDDYKLKSSALKRKKNTLTP